MKPPRPASEITRRNLLGLLGPALAASGLLSLKSRILSAEDSPENPYLETPSQDEGPFYREGAPSRADLRQADSANPPMSMTGIVRAEDGKPLPGVTLDLWHADGGGAYDNDSKAFRFRGKVKTDKEGKYRFDTNFPGQYGDGQGHKRPIHIHCKLSGDGLYDLTTQMYFKVRANVDVPAELVPEVTWTGEGKARAGAGVWNVFLARKAKS